jgi:hypothetical protein
VRCFNRLKTVGHASKANCLYLPTFTGSNLFNLLPDFTDVGNCWVRWIPQFAEIKQRFRITVAAIVRTSASVCVQPYWVFAFGSFITTDILKE